MRPLNNYRKLNLNMFLKRNRINSGGEEGEDKISHLKVSSKEKLLSQKCLNLEEISNAHFLRKLL